WWKTSARRLYDSTPPGLGAGGGTARMWPSWRAGEVMPPWRHRSVSGVTRSPDRGLSRGPQCPRRTWRARETVPDTFLATGDGRAAPLPGCHLYQRQVETCPFRRVRGG